MSNEYFFRYGASPEVLIFQLAPPSSPPLSADVVASGNIRGPKSRNGFGVTEFMNLAWMNPSKLKDAFTLHGNADLFARDDQGRTALFFSIFAETDEGIQSSVLTLLGLGFPIDTLNMKGGSPLLFAAQKGETKAVEILLEQGANVFAKDNYGNSAMHFAQNIETVRLLKSRGLSMDDQDFEGKSLLHFWATDPRKAAMIRDLIKLGARRDLKDKRGYTPFEAPESFYNLEEKTKKKESKKSPKLTLTDRTPTLVPAHYIYVSINDHIREAIDSLSFTPTDFTQVIEATEELGQSIKRYAISKNTPGIAVDAFRISLLKIMHSKVSSTLSDTFFHKDLANTEKTKRWWKSFHGLVTDFRHEMNWENVCPAEENIENQAVQNLRNLIVPVEYLDDSYIKEILGTRVTTERKPVSPEDLNFYSALTDTSARLLSTGGAWGLNYRRVVRGTELKVMIDSAQNIGAHVTLRYIKNLGFQKPHSSSSDPIDTLVVRGSAPAPVMSADGRTIYEALQDSQKLRHKYNILQSLAQKLYTQEDSSNPYADKLTRHQTAAFFLASRKALENLKRETCWDDKDMDATILFANRQLAATGRTLKVDRDYMDNLLGRIYDRLGT